MRLVSQPEYNVWRNMRQRCTRKTHPQYADYGGRGIVVCQRWDKFENFLLDMGERPKGMTLERVNNDAGYCARNCVWAPQAIQNRNTRRNIVVGDQCLTDRAAQAGLHPMTVRSRAKLGMSWEQALTTPLQQGKKFDAVL